MQLAMFARKDIEVDGVNLLEYTLASACMRDEAQVPPVVEHLTE